MTSKRPNLSNYMVCLTIALQDQYPALFEAVGRPEADEGGDVFVYDTLAALTGRDFDACWDALDRSVEEGLVHSSGTFRDALLTAQGSELVDKSHIDLLTLCRRHASHLEDGGRAELLAIIEATPRHEVASLPTIAAPLEPVLDLDDVGDDIDPDDDLIEDVEPTPARRRRP